METVYLVLYANDGTSGFSWFYCKPMAEIYFTQVKQANPLAAIRLYAVSVPKELEHEPDRITEYVEANYADAYPNMPEHTLLNSFGEETYNL